MVDVPRAIVRTAIVCGATAGLGAASARALAAAGMNMVLVGRRAELLDELCATLPSAVGIAGDLLDPQTITDAVAEAARFGGADVVLINGGGPKPGTAAQLSADAAAEAVAQLMLPGVRLVAEVLPRMVEQRWGRILAVGSTGVQQPIPGLASSNVGRAALAAYLKTLAHEVAADGVTVNMVIPGRIATDRVASLDGAAAAARGVSVDQVASDSRATIPAGRYGDPGEFGAAVAFLASEGAAYITGEQLRVDGGLVRGF